MRTSWVFGAAVPLLLSAAASATAGKPTGWVQTDLGLPTGGTSSIAHAVNNRGDIAGATYGTDGRPTSLGWVVRRDAIDVIGTSGGPRIEPRAITNSGAIAESGDGPSYWRMGIATLTGMSGTSAANSNGVVVGWIGGGQYAAAWRDGLITSLPSLGGEVRKSGYALAINDSGLIGGGSLALAGDFQPTLWRDGTPSALPVLPGDDAGWVFGLNDRGWAVGYTFKSGVGTPHPVLWKNGVATALWSFGVARAVNNRGVVVGTTSFGSPEDACVWENGLTTELPDIGYSGRSAAYAINDSDLIVGWAWVAADGTSHAARWSR